MSWNPVGAVFDLGSKLIDRLWPDPQKKAEAQLELIKLQQAGELQQIVAQLEVNKIEAANPNLFVSGWRPFVGWVCGSGLAMQFVVRPLAQWILNAAGHPVNLPALDMETLLTCLGGMLGLGTLRTVEKAKGVAAT